MLTSRSNAILASFLLLAATPVVTWAGDLSRYRGFAFGMTLPALSKQAGVDLSQVKIIQSRPALIQELTWRPQPLGGERRAESVKEVAFSFLDGSLFRIAVNYDRYETEGLTAKDVIDAISADFGTATKPTAVTKSARDGYSDQEEVLAEWQDSEHSFVLSRTAYGPTFQLVGTLKKSQVSEREAIVEAARLDAKEAPLREAERIAKAEESDRANLEKARLANKSKFKP